MSTGAPRKEVSAYRQLPGFGQIFLDLAPRLGYMIGVALIVRTCSKSEVTEALEEDSGDRQTKAIQWGGGNLAVR